MAVSAWHSAHRRTALGAIAAGLAAGVQSAAAQSTDAARAPGHVVLLGDSVFDNAGYLRGTGPDVAAHLRTQLPGGWRATLLAKGGSVTSDVAGQLGGLPAGATHLVISAGGNDAGRRESILGEPARSVADGLTRIAIIREGFARDYRMMLDAALGRGLPVAVCTIYDPRFPEPGRRQVAIVALAAFNDVITREAFTRGMPIIDLRLVCDRDEDFSGPTGPSVRGGGKIAAEIARFVTQHEAARRPEIFTGAPRGG
jgi:GDSL-like Lipase/Acylhydrolase family